MIDKDLLEVLRCPATQQAVRPASTAEVEALNARIRAGSVADRGGEPVTEAVDGGLVTEDGALLYPVRDGIPVMLVERAIPMA